jgi:cephalosporin-C deacetylase
MDEFWDSSLAEMKAIDPKVELVPHQTSSSIADYYHLYFTGVGGARIHAKYIRPKHVKGPHPAVIHFHGYSGSSGDWLPYLSWASQGFSVFALDCRGQGGGLSEDVGGTTGNTFKGQIIRGLNDGPERLLFRALFLDCAQLAGIAMEMPEVDPDRVGITGGSQGGGLTLACAALEPRIKFAAALFPFLCDYKRVWEMDLTLDAYEELRSFFRYFDPRHENEAEIFTRLGYIDVQHLAKRIKARVLMFVGLMDNICPPSTQFAAYNKITSQKDLVIYPDHGHEFLPDSADIIFDFMSTL